MLTDLLKFADSGLLGVCLVLLFILWQDRKMDGREKRLRAEADLELAKAITKLTVIIEERIPRR